jgi:hypothetical protein
MSETIATKAAAEACDTTPRVLRQFLRASKDYEAVGSGGRYAFTENDLPELKTRFAAWLAEREAARAAREKAAAEAKEKPATPVSEEGKPAEESTVAEKAKSTTTRGRKTAPAAKTTNAA